MTWIIVMVLVALPIGYLLLGLLRSFSRPPDELAFVYIEKNLNGIGLPLSRSAIEKLAIQAVQDANLERRIRGMGAVEFNSTLLRCCDFQVFRAKELYEHFLAKQE